MKFKITDMLDDIQEISLDILSAPLPPRSVSWT